MPHVPSNFFPHVWLLLRLNVLHRCLIVFPILVYLSRVPLPSSARSSVVCPCQRSSISFCECLLVYDSVSVLSLWVLSSDTIVVLLPDCLDLEIKGLDCNTELTQRLTLHLELSRSVPDNNIKLTVVVPAGWEGGQMQAASVLNNTFFLFYTWMYRYLAATWC